MQRRQEFFFGKETIKKLHESYDVMIEKIKEESAPHKIEANTANRNMISSDTKKRILDQLKAFENSEEFLKPNLTISLPFTMVQSGLFGSLK